MILQPARKESAMPSTAPRAVTPFVILLLCVGLAPGCGGSGNQSESAIKGLSKEEADQMNAGSSKFDNAQDPPFKAQTWFAAGQLAESQGNSAAAIKHYEQALKLDPKHQPSLYRLG